MSLRAALALAAASALLSGCVAAAAIPVVAGGLIVKNQIGKKGKKAAASERTPAPLAPATQARLAEFEGRKAVPVSATALPPPSGDVASRPGAIPTGSAVITGLTALPPPNGAPPAEARPPAATAIAPAGENAAFSIQAYQTLWSYVGGKLAQQRAGTEILSVVPEPGASFESLKFAPCGKRPLAVMIDIDQSSTPGVAFTRGDPDARWRRWKGDGSDPVAAVPGAVDTIAAIRREQVNVLYISARSPGSAPAVSAVLHDLGMGPAEAGKTLYLSGGTATAGEDIRRAFAAHYCVIAIAGDELADFTNLFDGIAADDAMRRNAAAETMVAPLWGAGWFLLPNPIYSTAEPGAQSLTGVN